MGQIIVSAAVVWCIAGGSITCFLLPVQPNSGNELHVLHHETVDHVYVSS